MCGLADVPGTLNGKFYAAADSLKPGIGRTEKGRGND